ncbi:MAG TPA: hypothetical protein VK727_05400 [Steroidobacteraceae bacterium]|nr:hypothetical protein [Steroidobacteraceae bacterium]
MPQIAPLGVQVGLILSDVGPIRPDIGAVLIDAGLIGSDIRPILADISTVGTDIGPILGGIAFIRTHVRPVLGDIFAIRPNVSTVLGQTALIGPRIASERLLIVANLTPIGRAVAPVGRQILTICSDIGALLLDGVLFVGAALLLAVVLMQCVLIRAQVGAILRNILAVRAGIRLLLLQIGLSGAGTGAGLAGGGRRCLRRTRACLAYGRSRLRGAGAHRADGRCTGLRLGLWQWLWLRLGISARQGRTED